MKKHLFIIFVILIIMSISTSTVFAATASKRISLLSAEYNQAGVVLIFETSGLTRADLKGASLYADSNWQKMYCTFIDNTTDVRCTLAAKLAGRGDFRAVLAGITILGELPRPKTIVSCQGNEIPWYSYDEYYNGTLVYSGEVPVWIWDEAVASGFFDDAAKNGYTFEITGTFCGPN